jgi:hypothetical protein
MAIAFKLVEAEMVIGTEYNVLDAVGGVPSIV